MASADESPGSGRYRFGDVVVDEAAHALQRAGQPQSIEPKAFAVLLALLKRPGELIGRDDLLDQVWGHRHVTPGVLTRAIAQLRNVLGDDPQNPRYIQTRHALGYCFVGELLPEPGLSPEATPRQAQASADDLQATMDVVVPNAGDLQAEASDQVRTASRQLHWRPRHWLAASLLAVVVFAVSIWSARQDAPRPANASVAVLPFTSLGPDRSHDYFAEGLAVEMHDALAGVPGLVVAAQMSPAVAQTREADIKALGQRLGVATVLDASVRREGDRVRINARLSDTGTGYTLWSRSYDREMAGIFAIQTEIANDVVKSLVGVIPGQRETLEKRLTPTRSTMAFETYLKGLQRLRSSSDEQDADAAVGLFGEALETDVSFGAAQLGICRSELWRFQAFRNAAALEKAREACVAAEKLLPGNPQVDLLAGDVLRLAGDLDGARSRYAAVSRYPAFRADLHLRNGMLLERDGQHSAALEEYAKAREARPADPSIIVRIGYQQHLQGRTEEAIASYEEAARLRPEDERLWSGLAGLYINAGRRDEAAEAFRRSLSIRPNRDALLNYAILEYQGANYPSAASLLRRTIEMEDDDFLVWGALGDALLAQGAKQEAVPAYVRARAIAADYSRRVPTDVKALAALGWYAAVLGDVREARELALRSEASAPAAGDIALINAQTWSLIGSREDVARRIDIARATGIPQSLLDANPHILGQDASTSPRPTGRS